jgi:hypothetical protein
VTHASLALALLFVVSSTVHARQPSAPADLVDAFIDGGLLPPHQAPGVIHETLFGWSDPQQEYSTTVPDPLEPGVVQIGENIAFEPFEIEPIWVFDLMTPAVQNDPSLVPTQAWYGVLRGLVGEIPAAGYAIEVDGVTSLILVTTSANTYFGVDLAAYMRDFPIADALTLSPTHRLSALIDRIPSRTHFKAGELHANLEFPFAWMCPDRAFQDEAWWCAVCLGCAIANSAACPLMCAGDHWDTPGESFGSCMKKCAAAQLRISNPKDAIADCLEGNCDDLGAALANSVCGASCGGCAVLGKVAKWFDKLGDPPSQMAPRPVDWIWK